MNTIKTDELQAIFSQYGLNYNKDLLFNFYLSLISKPFVILSGISGSGKSKIAEVFAKITCDSDKEKNYELVPVKPNWRDSKGIFGFHNIIDNSYSATPAIKLFIKALAKPESPFFLILDEMNIAKTEHYFADYLSLIESRYEKVHGFTDETFEEYFLYPNRISLSKAIILSAIDLKNTTGQSLAIEKYRENRFSKKWKIQFSEGNNWTAQFRSELNQEDRLANRVFTGGNGYYSLKPKNKLNIEDLAIFEELENYYLSLFNPKEIVQENIVLHNSSKCLCTNGCACSEECHFSNSEKYKCTRLRADNDLYYIPPELPIPINLFTIGTVNIDETTYMFSPKVLDRSNVIEFNTIDFVSEYKYNENKDLVSKLSSLTSSLANNDYYFNTGTKLTSMNITIPTNLQFNSFINSSPDCFSDLIQVYKTLSKYNMHFGYRVMNEISTYICNAKKYSSNKKTVEQALDFQFLQKILPKLNGTFDKLWDPLTDILLTISKKEKTNSHLKNEQDVIQFYQENFPNKNNDILLSEEEALSIFKYPRTAVRISRMLKDLESEGFTSYIK